MTRREFMEVSIATGVTAAASSPLSAAAPSTRRAFKLAYAPHLGMFRNHAGDDPVAQLEFMAAEGFTAFEDNAMAGRPIPEQERLADAMERLGIRMGVFVVNMSTAWGPTLASGDPASRDRFLAECRAAVEVASRVRATWMTVVPGTLVPSLQMDYQNANVIDALKRGAEIFEPHNLVMVLEPLNHWRDHAGLFLTTTPQAYMLCRAVASPSCKILFDAYHQQISEGNLIPNLDRAWSEIAYIQVGDNPGRAEPTTGEINYRNVFRHLHRKAFKGIIGMEHGNSRPGKEGERRVIDAYAACDDFD